MTAAVFLFYFIFSNMGMYVILTWHVFLGEHFCTEKKVQYFPTVCSKTTVHLSKGLYLASLGLLSRFKLERGHPSLYFLRKNTDRRLTLHEIMRLHKGFFAAQFYVCSVLLLVYGWGWNCNFEVFYLTMHYPTTDICRNFWTMSRYLFHTLWTLHPIQRCT